MRFCEINEIAEWFRTHGIDADVSTWAARLQDLQYRYRTSFASGRKSGREPGIVRRAVAALPDWSEALLRVTLWGVWPSGEDWPRYYRAREAHDERRSLETAPGHLFAPEDISQLRLFLTLAMENGWDADVSFADGNGKLSTHILVSHDEWLEIHTNEPLAPNPLSGRADR